MFHPAQTGLRPDHTSLQIIDVDEISDYIKALFDSDPLLANVWIRGEVSNARRSATGHWYFTLKSSSSELRCALFKSALPLIDHKPADGYAVLVNGRISSYPKFGQYQLYVEQILPEGEGLLQLQLQALRQKLEDEGLFDETRKRPLPKFPSKIAVITSPTGAVWHDIQDVLRRRYPLGELILSPATVQGDSAPASVISAIERVIADGQAEVIIVARGGGSIEDLWAFNDERVIRSVYRSPIPVVSAIGHETDVTLTDLVADVRAPTPSAAAELVAPHIREYVQHLRSCADTLTALMNGHLNEKQSSLHTYYQRLARFDPKWTLQQEQMRLDRLADGLQRSLDHRLKQERLLLKSHEQQLHLLDPRQLLSRGYALVTGDESGARVVSTADITSGDRLRLDFRDGSVRVTVNEVNHQAPVNEKETET